MLPNSPCLICLSVMCCEVCNEYKTVASLHMYTRTVVHQMQALAPMLLLCCRSPGCLVSVNRSYKLCMQANANLMLFNATNQPIW